MIKRDLYYERIPTKSLREDVRLLGSFLGRVIKEQEGTSFYRLVEKIRLLSKVNKKNLNKKKTNTQLINEINKLKPQKLFKLTRSFSHLLNLMNLAESLDGSRKLNEYENTNSKTKNQNIFIEEIIKKLFKNKKILNIKFTNKLKT